MKTQRMYTRDTLAQDHPDIADAVDHVFAIRGARRLYRSVWVNYCGRYRHANGKPRMVSLGSLIDFLYGMGAEIGYTIVLPDDNKIVHTKTVKQ